MIRHRGRDVRRVHRRRLGRVRRGAGGGVPSCRGPRRRRRRPATGRRARRPAPRAGSACSAAGSGFGAAGARGPRAPRRARASAAPGPAREARVPAARVPAARVRGPLRPGAREPAARAPAQAGAGGAGGWCGRYGVRYRGYRLRSLHTRLIRRPRRGNRALYVTHDAPHPSLPHPALMNGVPSEPPPSESAPVACLFPVRPRALTRDPVAWDFQGRTGGARTAQGGSSATWMSWRRW